MPDHLFVVTGGPGAGKTSLLRALARHGLPHMPEAGRAIIRQQMQTDGTALPWDDRAAFARHMFRHDLHSYRDASAMTGPVLMDRGLPDVLGYLALCGLPLPADMTRAARTHRYNSHVFLAPHWPEIYRRDAERKQDSAEARATSRIMAETYTRLGYTPIPLPRADIETRAAFVLRHIGA
ncbi:AAA family ATPase [Roseovarius sp. MMSF_3281]|uniref:AAA family ATPase n=1 Tax=Roseovarius sp. MMSF_3281 TaxID=3046694 RepID=UPI00273D2F05|nr:AAA family ATPase [Roseovarius sp. MMSF_3281]